MARLDCKCGMELSNSNHPEIQYLVFSDKEWLQLADHGPIMEPAIEIPWPSLEYWKCPQCGRLMMFERGKDQVIATYVLETS